MSNKRSQKDTERLIKEYTERGHRKPVTRREFIAAGLIKGGGFMLMPSILQTLLNEKAYADGVCPTSTSSMPSLITVNLQGGACLAWDFLALDSGGNILPSYSKLGLGTKPTVQTSTFASKNKISSIGTLVPGIISGAGMGGANAAKIMARTVVMPILSASRDDSSTNTNNISVAAVNAGLVGKIAEIGSNNTISTAVGSTEAFGLQSVTPLSPQSVNDVVGALSSGTTGAFGSLTNAKKASVLRLVNSISSDEAARLANSNGGPLATQLFGCAATQNGALAVAAPAGDPRTSSIAGVWGINSGTSASSANAVNAAMVFAGLSGNSGPVGLNFGGYDYHGQGQQTQNDKHTAAGVTIGQILASASLLGKDVFIHLVTDGATASSDSTSAAAPQGDSGNNGMNVVIMYRATGTVPTVTAPQIGYFDANSQQNNPNSPTANITVGAVSAFAHYMQFAGKISQIGAAIPNQTTDTGTLAKLLGIA